MAESQDFKTEKIGGSPEGATAGNGKSHHEDDGTVAFLQPGGATDESPQPVTRRGSDQTHDSERTAAFDKVRLPSSQIDATLPLDENSQLLGEKGAAVPKQIKNYEILGVLGRGGMGVVYKARQRGLNRMAALKMILAAGHASVEDVFRFQTEAEAVAKLQHANIVQIYEVGESDGHPFFSLEFVDGGTLSTRLTNNPLPAMQAAELIEPLARAMDYAHQNGILHRDIKPGNILMTIGGTPKITDFGLAKRMGDDSSNNTGTGSILGTPAYMSPEQAEGKVRELGPGVDIYALGSVLYHALTGRPPFLGETVLDTLQQVKNDDPLPPSKLQPKVPRDLETICLKCLEKEPRKRYQSAGELADDLSRFMKNEPIKARPVSLLERGIKWARRRPQIAALLGTLLFVIVGGFLGMFTLWVRAERLRSRADDNAKIATENEAQAVAARKAADESLEETNRTLYAAQMNRAQDAINEAKIGRLRDLLRDHSDRKLVGFEWKYLSGLLKSDVLPLKGHASLVRAVAFRPPDGKQFASASGDGTIFLWEPEAKGDRKFRQLKDHAGVVRSLAFNKTGDRLASAGEEGVIQIWDLPNESKDPIKTIATSRHGINALAFGPASDWLVAGSEDGSVRIWPLLSEDKPAVLPGHLYAVTDIAVTPDGSRIASASLDKTARVWDSETRKPLFTCDHDHWVTAVAFSNDGKTLATASFDKRIRLWDAATGSPQFALDDVPGAVRTLAFSPDGSRIAASCQDHSVIVWDLVTKKVLRTWPGEPGKVRTVAFSPDGQLLASVDFSLPALEGRVIKTPSTPMCLAFGDREARTFDGANLVMGGSDGGVYAWNVDDPTTIAKPAETTGAIRSIAVGPMSPGYGNGPQAPWAIGSENGDVILFRSGKQDVLKGDKRWVQAVALNRTGDLLASGSAGGVIYLWNTSDVTKPPLHASHNDAVRGLAFRDDGKQLASVGSDRVAYVWNPSNMKTLFTLKHDSPLLAVAYQPGGNLLAVAGADRTVRLWDSSTGQRLRDLRGHTHAVTCVTFTPDGRRLVSGSDDGTIKVWDPATGQETLTLRGHTQGITGVAFNPDGSKLASSSWDQTIRLWETPKE